MKDSDYDSYKAVGVSINRDLILCFFDEDDKSRLGILKHTISEVQKMSAKLNGHNPILTEFVNASNEIAVDRLLVIQSEGRKARARFLGLDPAELPPLLQPVSDRPTKFFRPFNRPDFTYR
jgi:hypothetical protein